MFSKYVWQDNIFEILIYIFILLVFPPFPSLSPSRYSHLGLSSWGRDEMGQKVEIALKRLFLKA